MHFHDYILNVNACAQQDLINIIDIIEQNFPEFEARLYRGIPTYFYGEIEIIKIKAYNGHFSLFAGWNVVNYLKEKYPSRRYTKLGWIIFTYKRPFPYEILVEICAQIKTKYLQYTEVSIK